MSTKDYSSKQEKMIADYLGWSVVSGSGAAACYPGDIISDEWLGECKTHMTTNCKIVFKKSHWKKICDESTVKRRFPVLFTDDGSQKSSRTWCLFKCIHLDRSRSSFLDLPDYNSKVNLTFIHNDLEDRLKFDEDEFGHDKYTVLRIRWNNEYLALCPLHTFRNIFQ